MSEERKHVLDVEIAAPRDLVWKAITEGAEIMKWFAPEARVEPGVGGSILLSWGPGMEGKAPITIWEPGQRFGWLEDHGGKPRVVEILLEGEGGVTHLRLVHSGFGADASFDAEYEATHGGWRTFLAMLRYGLEHHPGQPAVNVTEMRMAGVPQPELWQRAKEAAGLEADAVDGDRCALNMGAMRFEGAVVRAPQPGYLCVAEGATMIAIFAERAGGASILTGVAILFGAAAENQETVRAALAAYVDDVSGSSPAAAVAGSVE